MQKKSETRKQFTESRPSIGLGDTIQKVTKATGIEFLTKFVAGEDCGCDARKHKLNKLFRYRKPECLTKEEYEFIGKMRGRNTVTAIEQTEVNRIYNRVFKDSVKPTNCGSCLRGRVQELETLYNAYVS